MKKLLLLIPLWAFNSHACELKNKDFIFSYQIESGNVIYSIERKDKKEFTYFRQKFGFLSYI